MEYVDGEDLASLLRRIGRFPPAIVAAPFARRQYSSYSCVQASFCGSFVASRGDEPLFGRAILD
jgi:hypothetical protein